MASSLTAIVEHRKRDERGAVAILVSVISIAMCVSAAMVLDFGVARLDRQKNKSVADTAVAAGLRGLDTGGNGKVYSYHGVCQALAFLKSNEPALSSLTWSSCSDVTKLERICDPSDTATHATFSGTVNGISVEISNPYNLAASGWPEEALTTLADDQPDAADVCNYLAVVIRQTRSPVLGSLVTDSSMTTAVRSVGRVQPGERAEEGVALVLLERTTCRALHVEGTSAKLHVFGNGTAPGLIHADSKGTDPTSCTSDNEIINVNSTTNTHAVVAHAAETVGATGTVTPGNIGIYGLLSGHVSPEQASDEVPRVYAGPHPPGRAPSGRGLLTRQPIHDAYAAGVSAAIAAANSAWATPAASTTVSGSACSGNTGPPNPNTAGVWYFDCDVVSYNANVVLPNAATVIIRGQLVIEGSRSFSLPKATRVYINRPVSSSTQGLVLKGQFRMHTNDANGSTSCASTTTPSARARLVIGKGSLHSEGSAPLFRACDTTLVMMGGSTTGCIPSDRTLAPQDTTACTSGSINLAGNAQTDWTAPDLVLQNRTDADMTDLEDLALWTESEATSSIAGNGGIYLAGVFSLPNAKPFNIGGGGVQNVWDSQYFTRRLEVRGNGTLQMKPNPYNLVMVPYLGGFELVR